ncbi:hypothetical protein JCM15548_173 [Geofilum rubicundum JCM 15548]|uniref:Uncharacterized protein n=1 Tax=Geofilum rubicundum JCM 15548 TaxID=1236989 RepID=A0A0E9LRA3_9BACT|nr:hypothetical protein JCM15548_173 [Geofilum rubicundum JCM 15548]
MKKIFICWILIAVFGSAGLEAQNCDYGSRGNDIVQDKPALRQSLPGILNIGN